MEHTDFTPEVRAGDTVRLFAEQSLAQVLVTGHEWNEVYNDWDYICLALENGHLLHEVDNIIKFNRGDVLYWSPDGIELIINT